MLDRRRHQTVLLKILKEIYSDVVLRKSLGFKGGTAAYLFYHLPRFSIDLDFDLLDTNKKEDVFERCKALLPQFGNLLQAQEKRYTLFFLLSYQQGERKVKVEISKRPTKANFEVRHYLGIPMLMMKKQDMVAMKLSAILTRKRFAARDLFDLWFFLKNDWPINKIIVKKTTGLNLKQALIEAAKKIKKVKKNQLLQGLGELLEERQKTWVKEKLKEELIFQLKLRLELLPPKQTNN